MQTKQLQDAVASGKFDAIITQPLYGAGMVEDVKKAIDAGIAIGNIDQILGADNTTAESQIPGMMAERRVRPEHARQEDRRARRRGLRREGGQPLQRRLHLVGQGGRARRDPAPGLRRGHGQPSRRSRSSPRASPSTRRRSASRPPRTCSRPIRTCRSSSGRTRPSPAPSTAVGPDNAGKIAPRRLRRRRDRPPGHQERRALRHRHADAGDRGPSRHGAADQRHPDRHAGARHGPARRRCPTAAS